jgi:hypothetical protein
LRRIEASKYPDFGYSGPKLDQILDHKQTNQTPHGIAEESFKLRNAPVA